MQRSSAPVALLIVDMVGTLDFPRCASLRRAAHYVAPRLAVLKARVEAAGGLCVHANDDFADWCSDFQALVQLARQSPGREVLGPIAPDADDAHVLEPRHSPFHQTALHRLLKAREVSRVLISGVSTESCVLASALDARIRELDVCMVSDCVASSSPARRMNPSRSCATAMFRYVPQRARSTRARPDRSAALGKMAAHGL